MAIHSGHRQRMKEKLRQGGIEGFADHEILETLLYYPIPFRDTNPTAHALLELGGSLAEVPHLSQEAICSVPYCGESTALFLRLFWEAGRRCAGVCREGKTYSTEEELRELAMEVADPTGDEDTTVLVMLNNHFRIIEVLPLWQGYFASAAHKLKELAEPALRSHASMVMLVSTHKRRIARPDPYEIHATEQFAHSLSAVGVKLLEHYFVSGSMCMSAIRQNAPTPVATLQVHMEEEGKQ